MPFVTSNNKIEYLSEDGKMLAEITFPAIDENTVNINHTFVDEVLRGQGVAGRLMELTAEELEKTGRKAVATCSYAKKWFEKYPEKAEKIKDKSSTRAYNTCSGVLLKTKKNTAPRKRGCVCGGHSGLEPETNRL